MEWLLTAILSAIAQKAVSTVVTKVTTKSVPVQQIPTNPLISDSSVIN